MKIISLIIATLTIGMFMSGFFTFTALVMHANGQNVAYTNVMSNNTANNISATQQTIETMYQNSVEMQNNTNTGQQNYISFAPWNLITGAYKSAMQAIQAPIFFISLIGDLVNDITGMPIWVYNDLVAIISAIVVWELVYLIIGRK